MYVVLFSSEGSIPFFIKCLVTILACLPVTLVEFNEEEKKVTNLVSLSI